MKKGFTLIEFLVYMGLMSLFLIVLSNILSTSLETFTQSNQATLVDADSRYILNRLAYDVGHAATITTPATVGQTTNSLVLDVGTYTNSGGNLLLGIDRLNGFDSTIANFSVTRIGNGTGKDTVKISFDITSGSKTQTLSTTLGLR